MKLIHKKGKKISYNTKNSNTMLLKTKNVFATKGTFDSIFRPLLAESLHIHIALKYSYMLFKHTGDTSILII